MDPDFAEPPPAGALDEGLDSINETPISVIKLTFGHPEASIYGLLAIFFHQTRYQVLRVDCIVSFEAHLFDINPGIAWQEFERTIIDQLTRRNLNYRFTNELRSQLDEHINYHTFEEFSALLRGKNHEGLTIFFRTFLEKLYGDPGFRTVLYFEEIAEDDFENRAPDEEVTPLAPEEEEEPASTPYSPAVPVLSPVFGTLISELEVGDSIWVRPQNSENQDRQALSEEAVIRSITHDDSTGYIIFAELGIGRIVRLVETENVRFRSFRPDQHGRLAHIFAIFSNTWFLLFLLLFALIVFIINI